VVDRDDSATTSRYQNYIGNRIAALDPSASPPAEKSRQRTFDPPDSSALLIDATRKWPYPPISLPRKEFMVRAREIWDELDLPKLREMGTWFGHELGDWSEEDREEAELALQGKHYEVGEKAAKKRQPI
jgi:hypothetical protein